MGSNCFGHGADITRHVDLSSLASHLWRKNTDTNHIESLSSSLRSMGPRCTVNSAGECQNMNDWKVSFTISFQRHAHLSGSFVLLLQRQDADPATEEDNPMKEISHMDLSIEHLKTIMYLCRWPRHLDEKIHIPIPSTLAISSTFSIASLVSICTMTTTLSLAAARYPCTDSPQVPWVKGLPKPLRPFGGNLESATTSLAFSALETYNDETKKYWYCYSKREWNIYHHRYDNAASSCIESILDLPTCTPRNARRWDPDNWGDACTLNSTDALRCARNQWNCAVFAINNNPW